MCVDEGFVRDSNDSQDREMLRERFAALTIRAITSFFHNEINMMSIPGESALRYSCSTNRRLTS